jgi:hypothetical protein
MKKTNETAEVTVVKALCYKPEDRGFETWWGEFLQFTYSFRPH